MSGTAQRSAVVIAGHGSRDPDALREFEALVELVRARAGERMVRHGYLEFAAPTIAEAAAACVAEGATEISVVPGVLLGARHAKNDMPAELLALAQQYPQVDFHFGAPMDLHPLLLQLAQQRVVEAEAGSGEIVNRQDSCLVLVGRGTTDPDANGEVAKLARMLQEGMGFGGVKLCFSGTAAPLVRDGLSLAAGQGWQRLVVLPFFLFDGVLVKRIYAAADEAAQREPGVEVLKAGYLGVHPHVADVLLERAREAVQGRAAMNCSLCKYRVQIVGFEQQVGEPQRAHHLQVRDLSAREMAMPAAVAARTAPYVPHPIEAESMRIIGEGRDWSVFPPEHLTVLQRLVHTSGDFAAADELYFSAGAAQTGMLALLRCKRVVTDVTMVQTGLKRQLLEQLGIETWCGVHDPESHLMAQAQGLAEIRQRRGAGHRRRAYRHRRGYAPDPRARLAPATGGRPAGGLCRHAREQG
jgi:precorrin-8X/cobalt-precorrin-8 methylmutase